ncbi:PucR family transcriptional regulator [Kitasatospora sp. LaBMicrA B282]|uniref:PucR family transcriptional regulator n=1 Tax=Kitasatospora sp. LaBMicrA B282 TaxID=3420949 RepID=UPI003D0D49B5
MTDHNAAAAGPPPISFGGVPLHRRLATRVPELAASVVARLVAGSAVYAALPAEQLRGDITRVTERAIRGFVEVLRTGRPPDPEQLAAVRESAARRAEEGVPLEAVVGAYFLGGQECLGQLLPTAEPGDLAALGAAQQLLLDYLRLVTSAVAVGYVEEQRAAFGEQQRSRQELLTALLEGTGVQPAADRAGIELPLCYLVLSIGIGPHPDELAPGVQPEVAARRKLRRLRAELERHTRSAALVLLAVDRGLALVPSTVAAADWQPAHWARLTTAVAQLGRICGAELTVAAVPAAPDQVPAAARLAGEVRAVARSGGRGPGVYRLEDVLLAYQLSRPGPARDRLAALLAPLDERPELLDTLRAFLSCGLDRRRTAERLRIHPNTVDYRLRRLAALTTLDATRGTDLPTLHAALAARDAAAAGGLPRSDPW